jgi:spore coat protein H
VRRKRSGGERKVGLKVDINEFVRGQRYFTLRKLSLENGVSSGDESDGTDVREYFAEYLSWRAMVLSGAVSGRAAFARVTINGESFGVYVNVEQVDRSFLRSRLGDNHGWLYKKSGHNDGPRTHKDNFDDPYEEYFCFWRSGNRCPVPSPEALAAELPEKLDIPQILRVGAVNAIIANTDGPIFKDNNYYWYDWDGGPRVYFPWDLDTALKADTHVLGADAHTSMYTDVLFVHWRDDYAAILGELVESRLDRDAILAEIDRAEALTGAAFAADPFVSGSAALAAAALRDYYANRIAAVQAQISE